MKNLTSSVMIKKLEIQPFFDLTEVVKLENMVGIDIDFQQQLLILVAQSPLDYRNVSPSGASFAKIQPKQPQSYKILTLNPHTQWLDFQNFTNIAMAKFNFHHVQRLHDDSWLLVCGRSHYRSQDDFDKNGQIYDKQGNLNAEILLGDGIESVQVSKNGTIWTSYFDEGIFGNFGWHDTVGGAGLVAWNALGEKQYEFEPIAGLEPISDCYALNVVSDTETWCYYYTDFVLVKIKNFKIIDYWHIPVEGSSQFIIHQSYAIFYGSYHDKEQFYCVKLQGNHHATLEHTLQLFYEEKNILSPMVNKDTPIKRPYVAGRGNQFYIIKENLAFHLPFASCL